MRASKINVRKMLIVSFAFSLAVSFGIYAYISSQEGFKSCTIVTMSQGDKVYFANNEDFRSSELYIGFYPDNGFGSVHFGYVTNGQLHYEGAVNAAGLSWDINSVPAAQMNPHPEKPYSHAKDNFLAAITRSASTVDEVIELAKQFDFGDTMKSQYHISDAEGAAVVIGPGPDGEIAYTIKEPEDKYLVSTNFSLADPRDAQCWRHETAVNMLDENSGISPEFAMDILEAVHLRTLTSFTMYSNVNDPVNNKIFLCYMSQYNEMAVIDIEAELAKGERIVPMGDFFSAETVSSGDSDYSRFEVRLTAAKIVVVLLGACILTAIIIIPVLAVRRKKEKGTRKKEQGRRNRE